MDTSRCSLAIAVIAGLTLSGLGGCGGAPEQIGVATAMLRPASGSRVSGEVSFADIGYGLRVTGKVTGLSPGMHGFHIHERGDCSAPDATSAGGHFNPDGMVHGGPRSRERHNGDLGNIYADNSGTAFIDFVATDIAIASPEQKDIVGHALVVHQDADDEKTDPAGNSGARVACGVIK
jgi:Cu-Zn family superoxide dismutase